MDNASDVEKIRMFNRFYTSIISILDQKVMESGFSLAEGRILFEIGERQPCSARTLMDGINIDEGYLSRILNKYVCKGWLLKTQDVTDKRQNNLQLSSEGLKQLQHVNNIADKSTYKLIDQLSKKDLNKLMVSMDNIMVLLNPNKV